MKDLSCPWIQYQNILGLTCKDFIRAFKIMGGAGDKGCLSEGDANAPRDKRKAPRWLTKGTFPCPSTLFFQFVAKQIKIMCQLKCSPRQPCFCLLVGEGECFPLFGNVTTFNFTYTTYGPHTSIHSIHHSLILPLGSPSSPLIMPRIKSTRSSKAILYQWEEIIIYATMQPIIMAFL